MRLRERDTQPISAKASSNKLGNKKVNVTHLKYKGMVLSLNGTHLFIQMRHTSTTANWD